MIRNFSSLGNKLSVLRWIKCKPMVLKMFRLFKQYRLCWWVDRGFRHIQPESNISKLISLQILINLEVKNSNLVQVLKFWYIFCDKKSFICHPASYSINRDTILNRIFLDILLTFHVVFTIDLSLYVFGCVHRYISMNIYLYNIGRRLLCTSLFSFFQGKASGRSERFYNGKLPSPTCCCFSICEIYKFVFYGEI